MLHYGKRLVKTIFIHQFSHATMPLGNLFKNCAYYWLIGGVAIGWQIYANDYRGPRLPIAGSLAFLVLLSALSLY